MGGIKTETSKTDSNDSRMFGGLLRTIFLEFPAHPFPQPKSINQNANISTGNANTGNEKLKQPVKFSSPMFCRVSSFVQHKSKKSHLLILQMHFFISIPLFCFFSCGSFCETARPSVKSAAMSVGIDEKTEKGRLPLTARPWSNTHVFSTYLVEV